MNTLPQVVVELLFSSHIFVSKHEYGKPHMLNSLCVCAGLDF